LFKYGELTPSCDFLNCSCRRKVDVSKLTTNYKEKYLLRLLQPFISFV
jgi:hypothetical protein